MSKSKVGVEVVGEVDVVTITPTPTPDVLRIATPTPADWSSESFNTIATDETPAGNTKVGEAEATVEDPVLSSALQFHNYSSTRAESRKSSLHVDSVLKNLGEVPADFDSSKTKFSNSPFVRNFLDPVAAKEDFLNCLADYRLLLKKKKGEDNFNDLEDKFQDDYAQNLPGTSHQNQTGDVGNDDAQRVRACESMDASDIESISEDIVDKDNLVSVEVLNPGTGGSKDGRNDVDLPGPSHLSFSISGKEGSVKLLEEVFAATRLDIESEIGTAFPGFVSANDPPVKDNVEIEAEKLVLKSEYQSALATATAIEICIEPTYADPNGEEIMVEEVNLVSSKELGTVLHDSNVTPLPVTYHIMEIDPERVFLNSEYESVFDRACEPDIFIEPKVGDAEQIFVGCNETKEAGDILADAESVVERVTLVSPDPDKVVLKHKVNDLDGNNPAENDEGESLEENYTEGNVSAINQSEGCEAESNNLERNQVVEDPNVVLHPVERMVIKVHKVPYSWAMYDSMPDL